MSPSAKSPDVLERLVEQYERVAAPAPSSELLVSWKLVSPRILG